MWHPRLPVVASIVILFALAIGCERSGSLPETASRTPLSPSAVAPDSTVTNAGRSSAATPGLPDRLVTQRSTIRSGPADLESMRVGPLDPFHDVRDRRHADKHAAAAVRIHAHDADTRRAAHRVVRVGNIRGERPWAAQ